MFLFYSEDLYINALEYCMDFTINEHLKFEHSFLLLIVTKLKPAACIKHE